MCIIITLILVVIFSDDDINKVKIQIKPPNIHVYVSRSGKNLKNQDMMTHFT